MRRRTVVKGAAWAAPVVTLGAAAPAEAASPPPITTSVSWTCKEAGGDSWRYTVALTVSNGLRCATFVRVPNFKVSVGGRVVISAGSTLDVPAGQSRTVDFTSDPTQESGPGTGAITYTYRDCAGATQAESRPIHLTALASCGEGQDRDEDRGTKSVETAPDAASTQGSPPTDTAPSPEATPTPDSPTTDTAPSPEPTKRPTSTSSPSATRTAPSPATGTAAPSPAASPATTVND